MAQPVSARSKKIVKEKGQEPDEFEESVAQVRVNVCCVIACVLSASLCTARSHRMLCYIILRHFHVFSWWVSSPPQGHTRQVKEHRLLCGLADDLRHLCL